MKLTGIKRHRECCNNVPEDITSVNECTWSVNQQCDIQSDTKPLIEKYSSFKKEVMCSSINKPFYCLESSDSSDESEIPPLLPIGVNRGLKKAQNSEINKSPDIPLISPSLCSHVVKLSSFSYRKYNDDRKDHVLPKSMELEIVLVDLRRWHDCYCQQEKEHTCRKVMQDIKDLCICPDNTSSSARQNSIQQPGTSSSVNTSEAVFFPYPLMMVEEVEDIHFAVVAYSITNNTSSSSHEVTSINGSGHTGSGLHVRGDNAVSASSGLIHADNDNNIVTSEDPMSVVNSETIGVIRSESTVLQHNSVPSTSLNLEVKKTIVGLVGIVYTSGSDCTVWRGGSSKGRRNNGSNSSSGDAMLVYPSEAYIQSFIVLPKYRQCGLGSHLLTLSLQFGCFSNTIHHHQTVGEGIDFLQSNNADQAAKPSEINSSVSIITLSPVRSDVAAREHRPHFLHRINQVRLHTMVYTPPVVPVSRHTPPSLLSLKEVRQQRLENFFLSESIISGVSVDAGHSTTTPQSLIKAISTFYTQKFCFKQRKSIPEYYPLHEKQKCYRDIQYSDASLRSHRQTENGKETEESVGVGSLLSLLPLLSYGALPVNGANTHSQHTKYEEELWADAHELVLTKANFTQVVLPRLRREGRLYKW